MPEWWGRLCAGCFSLTTVGLRTMVPAPAGGGIASLFLNYGKWKLVCGGAE